MRTSAGVWAARPWEGPWPLAPGSQASAREAEACLVCDGGCTPPPQLPQAPPPKRHRRRDPDEKMDGEGEGWIQGSGGVEEVGGESEEGDGEGEEGEGEGESAR